MLKPRTRIFLGVVVLELSTLLGILSNTICAQGQSKPNVPDHVLYEGFFRNLAMVNRKASELDRASGAARHGAVMKSSACEQMGVSDMECATVFAIASDTEAQLIELDRQAQSIIDQVREKHADGSLIPPPPPELAELQAKRESLVASGAITLKQSLTSNGSIAVARYLTKPQKTTSLKPREEHISR